MNEELEYVLETIRFKTSIYRDKKKRNLSFNDDDYYSNILNEYITDLQQENKELKKQLEENKHKGLYNTCLPYSTGYNKAIKEKENQQKEFIDYMSKTIEELETDDVGDEELKGYLIQEIDIFKEILSKYKEIIEK